jgi:hypothetical protein
MGILLFEVTNANLLFGFIPESLGLFLFGIGLIVFAISLRRVFNWNETPPENLKQAVAVESSQQ